MDISVLLLTAKGVLADKEKGFLAGSDDYVVKPFEPKELIFGLQAILRRYDKSAEQILHIGPMVINLQNYEVEIGEKTIYLIITEYELSYVLASKDGHVYTREFLIVRVSGIDYDGDDQTLNVHIKRIREKLPSTVKITTVRGVGYKLELVP